MGVASIPTITAPASKTAEGGVPDNNPESATVLRMTTRVKQAGKIADKLVNMLKNVSKKGADGVAEEFENISESAPVWSHKAAGIVSRIPGPIMMVGGICAAIYYSTHASKHISVWWAKRERGIIKFLKKSTILNRVLKGHDALFALVYCSAATCVTVLLCVVTFIARIPISALIGIMLSTIGVIGSVAIEMVCSVMDDEEFKATEYTRSAQVNRRMFLHGSMGVTVASAFILMASVR